MVKNIPNKYNQETLLEEFSVNYENKFDFFYLPIDKDVNSFFIQHDCNVGYAFVNFTHPHYLKQFYVQFHNKKWKKYKSPKICNISYARYQGTLELANHFRHSKILQHKDRKLKPLVGIQEANRIRDIEEMVRMQRER